MKRRAVYSALCLAAFAAFTLLDVDAFAQRRPTYGRGRVICHYDGPARSVTRALKFGSVAEAEAAVDRILKVAGLTRNFVIEASHDVDNAESGVDGNNRRYIYYNPAFMERIKDKAQTAWAAPAVMAHEIGHHLLGHRAEDGGGTPQEEAEVRYRQELEADKYSGFILRYMGAPLSKAQSAVEAHGEEDGSPTHPPMRARLDAIRAGWEEADVIIQSLAGVQAGRPARPPSRQAPETTTPEPRRGTASTEAPRSSNPSDVAPVSARNISTPLSRDRWAWTAFIDAPPEVLERVNCVVYQLHPTFRPSTVRVCERGASEAFALKAVGWGSFTMRIHVLMKDGRQYDLSHALRL